MNGRAYYNEHDPHCAQWLRNLIAAGHIAAGDVDERDVRDVRPDDLRGYTQCHFFAGIGVWSYALRLAGWGDDRDVWTGSCPCQPFSQAGKGLGFADERHLWPAWFHLIRVRRPERIRGEQVAGRDGLTWLDLVLSDLEGEDYTCGAIDTCAAGFGAPHGRQRIYFMADADAARRQEGGVSVRSGRQEPPTPLELGRIARLDNSDSAGPQGRPGHAQGEGTGAPVPGSAGWMADPSSGKRHSGGGGPDKEAQTQFQDGADAHRRCVSRTDGSAPGPTNGYWRAADWIACRDGKARPVEPGTFPLAHGAPARVGRLRAYGNCINAYQAAEFLVAAMEVMP